MVISKYENIKIVGLGAAVPEKWESLEDTAKKEKQDDFNVKNS